MPKLTKAKLSGYRKRLLEILDELGVKLEHMEDSVLRGENETSPDEVDEFGSENYSQEFQIDMIENEEKILRQVYDALERIESGDFGTCENCNQAIPERRLEILPYARYCVACQRIMEESEEKDQPPPQPQSDTLL